MLISVFWNMRFICNICYMSFVIFEIITSFHTSFYSQGSAKWAGLGYCQNYFIRVPNPQCWRHSSLRRHGRWFDWHYRGKSSLHPLHLPTQQNWYVILYLDLPWLFVTLFRFFFKFPQTKSALKNWTLFTKFLIVYPSRLIINGISTTFSRRCGNISNWCECISMFKETVWFNLRLIGLLS